MNAPIIIKIVLTSEQQRRRWSPQEKMALVLETYEPGSSVLLVAQRYGVSKSQLYRWRKLARDGACASLNVSDSNPVAPDNELIPTPAQMNEFHRVIGKMVMERELLEEKLELAKKQKRGAH